jgi:DNA repair protein REV1
MSYADDLKTVSVDEALINITSSIAQIKSWALHDQPPPSLSPTNPATELAETIWLQVKKSTSCKGIYQSFKTLPSYMLKWLQLA